MFALFCNPESRRVEGFCEALGRLRRERPLTVAWLSILERRSWQSASAESPRFLRLESPGRNWTVEKLLLARGAEINDDDTKANWCRLSVGEVAVLENVPGLVRPQRQIYLGWRAALRELDEWARQRSLAQRWLSPPEDVLAMGDKAACHDRLARAGVSVPPAIGVPVSFDDLYERMSAAGCDRVFLKPCHGSAASGVVALEASRRGIQAFSTVEIISNRSPFEMCNRRRITRYAGLSGVRQLVDVVCRQRCLAQAWIPKAGLHGRPFDLRVVVIGGRARQVIVRLGKGPMTNSQLLGGRGDVDLLRSRMTEEAWTGLISLCERAMTTCYPRSLYAGIDVLIEPNFRTARILEINAFGDLLPRVLHEGRTTYEWEIECALGSPHDVTFGQNLT